MKKKLSKIFAVILALVFIASLPLNAFAAEYKNKSTVSISCKTTKTYVFSTNDGKGESLAGSITFKKGGVTSADSVSLYTLSPIGTGKVRYMRVSITTTDKKTHTVQKKLEVVNNGTETKITVTEDGKVVHTNTCGISEFYRPQTITVKGTLWKAAKSIYASANITGNGHDCYLYFKT